ncbi:type II toxin-antitoxin system RelE/ParE family toxin [Methanoculleus sp. FWC-SCC1]|uniref:Type II toxin-antitoxin system RelE/ParE family toxin n=1 Tax=Methanoculleus frigidifontis TaxID=2584085 RepID=A0ABT8MAX5_9EURY|nr:type II toxin-antitoxin system RelE/ParE family toxin [Methanoculleus sp. FWC-SCC1]MDN7025090.1 type II toxin-antitoxin system RelE/ParE family toxin [Methanoculleus sp. FWC-SCC1]
MIWRLILMPAAERDLNKIPDPDAKRIKEELYALADEPYPLFHVKKLKGHQNSPLHSLRVGQYRIILAIEGNVMVITVIEIGNRSTSYRKY